MNVEKAREKVRVYEEIFYSSKRTGMVIHDFCNLKFLMNASIKLYTMYAKKGEQERANAQAMAFSERVLRTKEFLDNLDKK